MLTGFVRALAVAALALGLAMPVTAQAETKAKQETTKSETKAAKKEPSAKQKAARNRMKECGAEWQTMKKDGRAKGTTWRKFSSECLKRKKS